MTGDAELIEVLFDHGWKVGFRGYRFGPYPTRRDALETARTWGESARKQGYHVVVEAVTSLLRALPAASLTNEPNQKPSAPSTEARPADDFASP
jgi:hypothetical protein